MFMVIMTICTLKLGALVDCADVPFNIRMDASVDECLVIMIRASLMLHKEKPDWRVKNVTCIPMEET